MSNNSVPIAPFVSATVGVFRDMFDIQISQGQAQPEGDTFLSQGFTVIVGLTGGMEGWFILDMIQETALKLAEIICGESYNSVEHEEVLLTGAEVGNIISGNAITVINNQRPGLNCRLTPPSVFTGQEMSMFNVRLNACSVLMQCSAGSVKINVVAREGK